MNDSPLYLAKPDLVHYEAYRAMREEWLADGSQLSPWFLNLPVGSVEDFARLVKQLNDAQFANADPGYCTTTSYLVFDRAGTLVGASSLRHYLTLEGIRYFGHIGYGIRPGQRRKGYAKEVLRLMLAEATGSFWVPTTPTWGPVKPSRPAAGYWKISSLTPRTKPSWSNATGSISSQIKKEVIP